MLAELHKPTPIRKGEPMHPDSARRFLSVRFPKRHVAAVFDGAEPTPAQRAWISAAKRAIGRRGSALLWGDRGHGKTLAVVFIARDWCLSGCNAGEGRVRYWRLSDLFADQRAWFDRRHDDNGNAITEPLREARECGLLILDEIHERQDTEYAISELVRLIDHRYAEMRPTLLITNTTPTETASIIGASASDRIKEGGAVIECASENQRRGVEIIGGKQ